MREAAWRVLGQRHFDVQLMGGMALHFGWIAEMKTGEGKTLVSTLPVYLNALSGRGMHVITVNDYLAGRDADWMGQVHRFLGLTVGRVSPELPDFDDKREAYACDVTYGTNTEFGFDYLRDNMARLARAHGAARPRLRHRRRGRLDPHRRGAHPAHHLGPGLGVGQALLPVRRHRPDAAGRRRTTRSTRRSASSCPPRTGIAKVESQAGVDNMYDLVSVNYVHHLTQALRAKELYHRDKDYLVAGGEVKIVDEFTGRTLEGRRWSDGLHQAVEAKERVRIKEENHTWATVTLQNYFRLYEKLSGMTGTAETEAAEFASTYDIPVVPIPTNVPMVRDGPARPHLQVRGRQVRVRGRRHRRALRARASPCWWAPPRWPSPSSSPSCSSAGASPTRSSTPSSTPVRPRSWPRPAGCTASRWPPTWPGEASTSCSAGTPRAWPGARRSAQGVDLDTDEGLAEYEKLLARFEKECAEEGDQIRELGGLYVLGSERHESRRIDNQLRGRSGRQGDPGESRFFLSLEDELMRLFATGAMQWVMSRTLPDDVPIEAKMVTKAIERAQHTVEGRNAEIRKDVLKYDEVLNEQRKVIYARRLQVIDGEDLRERTEELLEQTIDELVRSACPGEFPEDVGARAAPGRGHPVLPDRLHGRRPGRGDHRRPDRREPPGRGARRLPRP